MCGLLSIDCRNDVFLEEETYRIVSCTYYVYRMCKVLKCVLEILDGTKRVL